MVFLLSDVVQLSLFLLTFSLQDVEFVLQNLDPLPHLGQVLAGRLDLTHISVPGGLDIFVHANKHVKFELSVLLFFGQIQNQQLLHLELLLEFHLPFHF